MALRAILVQALLLGFFTAGQCGRIGEYLTRYGYLSTDTDMSSSAALQAIEPAVERLQAMYGLPRTGMVDDATREVIAKSRCGVPDSHVTNIVNGNSRSKRWATAGSSWKKDAVTYRVLDYTKDLSKSEVDGTIAQAFQAWQRHIPITFQAKTEGNADIYIKFGTFNHGDRYSFDGEGGTLAHAFYPPTDGVTDDISGDMHFDESEIWTLDSSQGTNLYYVVLHELGHALGLLHSNQQKSIMWPWAQLLSQKQAAQLTADDIVGVQSLYGSRVSSDSPEPPSTEDSPSQPESVCEKHVDAVTATPDGAYFFIGQMIYKIGRHSYILGGYPKPISQVFPKAPSNVDSVLTYKGIWPQKKVYIFKGDSYWRYSHSLTSASEALTLDPNYPRNFQAGWGFRGQDFDAVFTMNNSKAVYFVKGDNYWKHSGSSYGLYPGYPRKLTMNPIFKNFPTFDAAFLYKNNKSYFFYKDQYYRVESADKVVGPRRTGEWWFSCISERLRLSPKGSLRRRKQNRRKKIKN